MSYTSVVAAETNLKCWWKFDDTAWPLVNSGPVTGVDIPAPGEPPLYNQDGKFGRCIKFEGGVADQLYSNTSAAGNWGTSDVTFGGAFKVVVEAKSGAAAMSLWYRPL